jgi:HK97 family phage prohead protease
MATTLTRRMVTEGDLEVRTVGGEIVIEGHASTFNQPYNMGWYTETVAPGAFARTLGRTPDVTLLINHEGLPLARTLSGTLQLAEDESGLYTKATLDASDPDVKRLAPKMARGDMNKMSFAFGLTDGGDEWSADYTARTMRHLNLDGGDVSVVTHPANPNATVSMRSRMLETPDRLRTMYRTLVESGNSEAGLSPQMRSLLENLAVEDETVEAALASLSALVEAPVDVRSDEDEAAVAVALAVEHELYRARIALLKLK